MAKEITEIPGYYWDADKKRYFKVEKSSTAPTNSAWSADYVKRRKIQHDEDEQARRRMEMNQQPIRRSRLLEDPVIGGLLLREMGILRPDTQAAAFARGMVKSYDLSLRPSGPGFLSPIQRINSVMTPTGDLFYVPIWPDQWNQQMCRGQVMANGRLLETNQVNVITPSPENASSLCVLGCSQGLARSQGGILEWIAPARLVNFAAPLPYRDIFTVDYRDQHVETVLAAGRPGQLLVGDMRTKCDAWTNLRFPTCITNLKSLTEHQVLVTGLRNTMSIYDLRWTVPLETASNSKTHWSLKTAEPVVTIHGYKNKAHTRIGLDVSKELGIIAAAHDDGKVALYSIKTGNRLASPTVDQIKTHMGPIESLQFQKGPQDVNPTLYISHSHAISGHTFGPGDDGDE